MNKILQWFKLHCDYLCDRAFRCCCCKKIEYFDSIGHMKWDKEARQHKFWCKPCADVDTEVIKERKKDEEIINRRRMMMEGKVKLQLLMDVQAAQHIPQKHTIYGGVLEEDIRSGEDVLIVDGEQKHIPTLMWVEENPFIKSKNPKEGQGNKGDNVLLFFRVNYKLLPLPVDKQGIKVYKVQGDKSET